MSGTFSILQAFHQLRKENEKLKAVIKSDADQISILQAQMGTIRKNTISFILEQMDALHIQRDSNV